MRLTLWLLLVGLPLAAAAYIGYIWLSAWFEVHALPRSEVYICNTHGPIQKESCISFMGVPYCPICFHTKMKSAEAIMGDGQRQ